MKLFLLTNSQHNFGGVTLVHDEHVTGQLIVTLWRDLKKTGKSSLEQQVNLPGLRFKRLLESRLSKPYKVSATCVSKFYCLGVLRPRRPKISVCANVR